MNEAIDIKRSRCRVGIFDIFPNRNVIRKNGDDISIEPRVMDVLCALIEASGHVVSRDDLIEKHWETVYGADESLTRIISRLRKTIREAGETEPYIETISKRGYRLVQPISWHEDPIALIPEVSPPGQSETDQSGDNVNWLSKCTGWIKNKKWRLAAGGLMAVMVAVAIGPQSISSYTSQNKLSTPTGLDLSSVNLAPVTEANSIAVLPFIDLSPSGDQEYFSDGISEEILNVLARIEGFKVASRTSSFQFKGQDSIGIPAIAQQLRVRYVLQGSVRKAGDSIRITTQLIEASTDQPIWSATFDRTLTTENIFAIQGEIAMAMVNSLEDRINLSIGQTPTLQATTSSVDAYEAFLKARTLYQNRTSIHEAEALLLQSITLDPNFADAWALRSAVYIVVYSIGPSFGEDLQSDREQSRLFAQRALDMQPNNVLALASLAFGDMIDLLEGRGDKSFGDVIFAFNKALEVDSKSIDVLNWRGIQMLRAGYFDKAIADFAQCIEIDRSSSPCRYNLMAAYAMNDQPQESVRVLYEALDYGAFSQDTLVLLVLSEVERRDLFLFAAGWNPQLRGWHRFGDLYDALQAPQQDHTLLRAQLKETFERNGINRLASDMLLSALGDEDAGVLGAVWWFDTYTDRRRTSAFKQQIKDIGVQDYWNENGYPPQCRPVNDGDFDCA